jgi:predicted NUDIX family NTP pyrophosphohydrolase
MAARISAGILLYRIVGGVPQVFLVHPGGPFWARKDDGAWTIPKGEVESEDDSRADLLATARREFAEETGTHVDGEFLPLAPIRQKSGKRVHAWALVGDIDASAIVSNTFTLEWPPRSGALRTYPEVDRGGWFSLDDARRKLLPAQCAFIDQLQALLD